MFSQFAPEKLAGSVHIKCAQFPKTSAEGGNTWIERDCLERETERMTKKKKKVYFSNRNAILNAILRNDTGITISTQAQVWTSEKTFEDLS